MSRKGAKKQRFFLAKAVKYSDIIYDRLLRNTVSVGNFFRIGFALFSSVIAPFSLRKAEKAIRRLATTTCTFLPTLTARRTTYKSQLLPNLYIIFF
jgi:hypothetical protein